MLYSLLLLQLNKSISAKFSGYAGDVPVKHADQAGQGLDEHLAGYRDLSGSNQWQRCSRLKVILEKFTWFKIKFYISLSMVWKQLLVSAPVRRANPASSLFTNLLFVYVFVW